jgi:hypothetical protein
MGHHFHSVTLIVRSARGDDVYKDIARVGRDDRGRLRTGRVHFFKTIGGEGYFILRGVAASKRGYIFVDSEMRTKLGIQKKEAKAIQFEIREASFWEELIWGWSATDPSYRANARLAVISLALGLLSVFLGAIGVWLGYLALHPVRLPN